MSLLKTSPDMADERGKHLRLLLTIFTAVVAVLGSLVLLFFLMRLIFGLLSYVPWLEYLYVVFLISFPAAVFITAFTIFFKRTRKHPAKIVRAVSLGVISLFLAAWAVFYVMDIIAFIHFQYTDINYFKTYNMLFLFANVAGIFFLGVAQALSTPKEKDWLDKWKDEN
jgi:hypothetical protein